MRSGCASDAVRIDDGRPPVTVARKLAAAFTLLFDGVGGPHTVSPYESAYVGGSAGCSDRRGRNGSLAAAIGRIDGRRIREPPDHLSIELALLARLTRQDAGHQAQAALLDDHLFLGTKFCRPLRQCDPLDSTPVQ